MQIVSTDTFSMHPSTEFLRKNYDIEADFSGKLFVASKLILKQALSAFAPAWLRLLERTESCCNEISDF